jgi:hypothetical protein
MLTLLADPQDWITFFTLTALELVLGVDSGQGQILDRARRRCVALRSERLV